MAATSLTGIYRNYLRQVRKLPVPYLRQFWQLKAADDIRAVLRTTDKIREKRVKRVRKDLQRIEAANNGSTVAFQHVLDKAYGRKGKLKRELMEPLLSDPAAPVPPRIIPQVESSRPPVYSPELRALVASSVSYRVKPLSQKSLDSPPTLPSRADPASEDARLLGPFSKRREVNTRWRYFTTVRDRVLPPLKHISDTNDTLVESRISSPIHLWGERLHDEAERLADVSASRRNFTRKEQLRYGSNESETQTRHPSRWLRRRYQQLLSTLPILKYSQQGTAYRCSVAASSSRIVNSDLLSPHRFRELQPGDAMSWVELAQGDCKSSKS